MWLVMELLIDRVHTRYEGTRGTSFKYVPESVK